MPGSIAGASTRNRPRHLPVPRPEEFLEANEISTRVNSVKNDSEENIAPAA
jgi:putative SOS response-associated peptidase YedK